MDRDQSIIHSFIFELVPYNVRLEDPKLRIRICEPNVTNLSANGQSNASGRMDILLKDCCYLLLHLDPPLECNVTSTLGFNHYS